MLVVVGEGGFGSDATDGGEMVGARGFSGAVASMGGRDLSRWRLEVRAKEGDGAYSSS